MIDDKTQRIVEEIVANNSTETVVWYKNADGKLVSDTVFDDMDWKRVVPIDDPIATDDPIITDDDGDDDLPNITDEEIDELPPHEPEIQRVVDEVKRDQALTLVNAIIERAIQMAPHKADVIREEYEAAKNAPDFEEKLARVQSNDR